jgi:hypothetical protein
MTRVYVAGPYTNGDTAENVRNAIYAGNNLRALGFTPLIPHLTHFWHLVLPHAIDYWYAYDLEWLELCDAVLRLPGESRGADAEVKRAQELGLPVFDNYTDLREWQRRSDFVQKQPETAESSQGEN